MNNPSNHTLENTVHGQLIAEYEGWRIYAKIGNHHSYTGINEGCIISGDSIRDVEQQIISRVGELSRKDDAWSGGVCENN